MTVGAGRESQAGDGTGPAGRFGPVDTPLLDTTGPDDLPQTVLSGQVREFFRHVQPRFYAADQLAQDIIRGIDRNTALVIAPAPARVAYYLWRYAPVAVSRLSARQLARSRAALPAHQAAPADLTPPAGQAGQ